MCVSARFILDLFKATIQNTSKSYGGSLTHTMNICVIII